MQHTQTFKKLPGEPEVDFILSATPEEIIAHVGAEAITSHYFVAMVARPFAGKIRKLQEDKKEIPASVEISLADLPIYKSGNRASGHTKADLKKAEEYWASPNLDAVLALIAKELEIEVSQESLEEHDEPELALAKLVYRYRKSIEAKTSLDSIIA